MSTPSMTCWRWRGRHRGTSGSKMSKWSENHGGKQGAMQLILLRPCQTRRFGIQALGRSDSSLRWAIVNHQSGGGISLQVNIIVSTSKSSQCLKQQQQRLRFLFRPYRRTICRYADRTFYTYHLNLLVFRGGSNGV